MDARFHYFRWRILFSLVLSMFFTTYIRAQELRKMIPPSPVSSEFEKYSSHTVSLVNGLPDINIDLYKISVGGVELPLSLSYHASGIKFNQNTGEVGVGWVLNPGQRISRTIYGLPDDKYPMPSIEEINNKMSFAPTKLDRDRYLSNFCVSKDGERFMDGPFDHIDGEYDIFNFSLADQSGYFVISNRNQKQVTMLDNADQIKLSYTVKNPIGINTFEITDLKGVKYIFGKDENNNDTLCELTNGSFEMNATAWPLTRIITPLGQEITFHYRKYTIGQISQPAHMLSLRYGGYPWKNSIDDGPSILPDQMSEVFGPPSTTYYEVYFPYEIVTPHEKIVFNRDAVSGVLNDFSIKDKDDNLLKTVRFYYGTYSNGQPFSFLDSLRIYNQGGTDFQKYEFDYNAKRDISRSFDMWGYCIPTDKQISLQTFTVQWTNDEAWINSYMHYNTPKDFGMEKRYFTADQFTLNKIVYPTGGYTKYAYESNTYSTPTGRNEKGPGIRIANIKTYNNWDQLVLHKAITYGKNEAGIGIMSNVPEHDNDILEGREIRTASSSTNLIRAVTVRYSSVQNPELSDSYTSGNWGYYDEVMETDLANGLPQRKTLSKFNRDYIEFTTFPTNFNAMTNHPPLVRTYDYANKPVLTDRIYYNMENLSSPRKVKSEHYDYTYGHSRPFFQGLKVAPYAKHALDDPFSPLVYDYYGSEIESVFNYATYSLYGGKKVVARKIDTTFAADGNFILQQEETDYNALDLPSVVRTSGNNGDVLQTENTYVQDYAAVTANDAFSAGIKKMVAFNYVGAPMEASSYRIRNNSKELISTVLYQYQPDRPILASTSRVESILAPNAFNKLSITGGAAVPDNHYVPAMFIDSYDANGNVLQQRLNNGIPMSYIWDYHAMLPVAEVNNAVFSDIAFTSFEADGNGSWVIPSTVRNTSAAMTGQQSYDLQNGSITKSNLNATQSYTVSYWMKSPGSVTVSGAVKSTTGISRNGWTYMEHIVNNITQLAISGSSLVDELRMYPTDASMSTYTYRPLIGITSQNNSNGMISYYNYDGFGRLISQLNGDGNILKQYSYVIQQNELSAPFKSQLKQQTVNRNNCATGTTGSAVTYTVPAGKYSSMLNQQDADAKAQADLDSHVQEYANSNGTCPAGYWNAPLNVAYTKNNCNGTATGGSVIYRVPAAKYNSMVSQQAADAMANNDATQNGQTYANTNGFCMYYNDPRGQAFQKSCSSGQIGSTVIYNVPAHKYMSTISQQDANNKAQAEIDANGQQYANNNGTCGTPNYYVTIKRGPVPGFQVRIFDSYTNAIVDMKDFYGNESGIPAYATILPTGQTLTCRVSCSGSMIVAINGLEQTVTGSFDFPVSSLPFILEMKSVN